MTITLIILGGLVLVIAIVALTAVLADPQDIQDEGAHRAEKESPKERREFLEKHSLTKTDKEFYKTSVEDASPDI